jgi:ferredoxin-type protein NapH
MKKTITTSTVVSFLMLVILSIFILTPQLAHPIKSVISAVWMLALTVLTFLMLKTGKTSRYRSIFFIIFAFSFVLSFVAGLIEERGSMALTQEIVDKKETPLCPVAIPQLILPLLFRQELIFPTKIFGGPYGGFVAIMLLWLVGTLALGRGWCSWGCFFGGIDEGFSKVLRKPVINSRKMNPRILLIPFVVLVVIVAWSFIAMEPKYCEWLCPLKLVTEYSEINSLITYLQAIMFITLGMGLLIILPILMKKRTQCSLLCPLGALQSLISPVNLYRIETDASKCTGCGRCMVVCPTFSIRKADGGNTHHASITCTRCGKCMDECPENALCFRLKGCRTTVLTLSQRIQSRLSEWKGRLLAHPVKVMEEVFEPRTLFIFTAIVFGGTLSGSMVTDAAFRIYLLITTGSLLTH